MTEQTLLAVEATQGIHGVRLMDGPSGLSAQLSPGLRSYRIVLGDGRVLGTVHGRLLTRYPSSRIAFRDDIIEVRLHRSDDPVDPLWFETEVLDHLHGTFLVATHDALPRRVYPDTGGTIPIVYCPASRCIAPSAGLLFGPAEYRERLLEPRVQRLIRREGMGSWIAGTLTAHDGVRRLLSNHYLDLETWEARRFWPRPSSFDQSMTVTEGAAIIAENLPPYVDAAAAELTVGVTLTAGFDSRILLAAARRSVERLGFFTIATPDSSLDIDLASRMARSLGLSHTVVPHLPASEESMERWDHAVGHAVLEGNRSSGPTLRSLPYDVIFTGIFGEPGRTRVYKRDYATVNDLRITPEIVLSRLSRPRDPELVEEVGRWLEPLRWLPSSAILDLAHMELKGCGWAMAQHAAQNAAILEMNPIGQRAIRRVFLEVPPAEKAGEALFREAIGAMWPDLLDWPFNRYGDYRDTLSLASKALSPKRVRTYLRARLGSGATETPEPDAVEAPQSKWSVRPERT